ncbi:hypothetical protein [Xanthobacter sp. ZOL 2024]
MARRAWEAEPADDYTPATDLVFSLFAMSVLLLAIFGAGSHVRDAEARQVVATTALDLDYTKAQYEQLRAERDALRQELAERPPTPPAAPLPAAPPAAAVTVDRAARPQVVVTLTQERAGAFLAADGRMAASVMREIRDRLKGASAQARQLGANEVVFEVSASLDPRSAEPLADAMARSMGWGEGLLDAFAATPLPVACVLMEPVGGRRAAPLARFAYEADGGRKIDDIVAGAVAAAAEKRALRMEGVRPQDDMIRVILRRNDESRCDPRVLAAALDRL